MKQIFLSFVVVALLVGGFLLLWPDASVPTVSATPTISIMPTMSQLPSPTQAAGAFTAAQVATHNSASSCYAIISGAVYDLTSFLSQHPGGERAILGLCGIDGTSAFNAQHGGQQKQLDLLKTFKIGVVAK